MHFINICTLLGLQALIAATLAQSTLFKRQSDIEACTSTGYPNAFCCNDSTSDCEDGTTHKPHYLISKLQADTSTCYSQYRSLFQTKQSIKLLAKNWAKLHVAVKMMYVRYLLSLVILGILAALFCACELISVVLLADVDTCTAAFRKLGFAIMR
jgi:hypothetical protein